MVLKGGRIPYKLIKQYYSKSQYQNLLKLSIRDFSTNNKKDTSQEKLNKDELDELEKKIQEKSSTQNKTETSNEFGLDESEKTRTIKKQYDARYSTNKHFHDEVKSAKDNIMINANKEEKVLRNKLYSIDDDLEKGYQEDLASEKEIIEEHERMQQDLKEKFSKLNLPEETRPTFYDTQIYDDVQDDNIYQDQELGEIELDNLDERLEEENVGIEDEDPNDGLIRDEYDRLMDEADPYAKDFNIEFKKFSLAQKPPGLLSQLQEIPDGKLTDLEKKLKSKLLRFEDQLKQMKPPQSNSISNHYGIELDEAGFPVETVSEEFFSHPYSKQEYIEDEFMKTNKPGTLPYNERLALYKQSKAVNKPTHPSTDDISLNKKETKQLLKKAQSQLGSIKGANTGLPRFIKDNPTYPTYYDNQKESLMQWENGAYRKVMEGDDKLSHIMANNFMDSFFTEEEQIQLQQIFKDRSSFEKFLAQFKDEEYKIGANLEKSEVSNKEKLKLFNDIQKYFDKGVEELAQLDIDNAAMEQLKKTYINEFGKSPLVDLIDEFDPDVAQKGEAVEGSLPESEIDLVVEGENGEDLESGEPTSVKTIIKNFAKNLSEEEYQKFLEKYKKYSFSKNFSKDVGFQMDPKGISLDSKGEEARFLQQLHQLEKNEFFLRDIEQEIAALEPTMEEASAKEISQKDIEEDLNRVKDDIKENYHLNEEATTFLNVNNLLDSGILKDPIPEGFEFYGRDKYSKDQLRYYFYEFNQRQKTITENSKNRDDPNIAKVAKRSKKIKPIKRPHVKFSAPVPVTFEPNAMKEFSEFKSAVMPDRYVRLRENLNNIEENIDDLHFDKEKELRDKEMEGYLGGDLNQDFSSFETKEDYDHLLKSLNRDKTSNSSVETKNISEVKDTQPEGSENIDLEVNAEVELFFDEDDETLLTDKEVNLRDIEDLEDQEDQLIQNTEESAIRDLKRLPDQNSKYELAQRDDNDKNLFADHPVQVTQDTELFETEKEIENLQGKDIKFGENPNLEFNYIEDFDYADKGHSITSEIKRNTAKLTKKYQKSLIDSSKRTIPFNPANSPYYLGNDEKGKALFDLENMYDSDIFVGFDTKGDPVFEYDLYEGYKNDANGNLILNGEVIGNEPIQNKVEKDKSSTKKPIEHDSLGRAVYEYINNKPVYEYDSNHNPIFGYNSAGDPVYGFDEKGPIYGYDDSGHSIYGFNEDGYGIFGYDEKNRPIFGYNDQGKPILGFTQRGNKVYGIDENGSFIYGYDNNNLPINSQSTESIKIEIPNVQIPKTAVEAFHTSPLSNNTSDLKDVEHYKSLKFETFGDELFLADQEEITDSLFTNDKNIPEKLDYLDDLLEEQDKNPFENEKTGKLIPLELNAELFKTIEESQLQKMKQMNKEELLSFIANQYDVGSSEKKSTGEYKHTYDDEEIAIDEVKEPLEDSKNQIKGLDFHVNDNEQLAISSAKGMEQAQTYFEELELLEQIDGRYEDDFDILRSEVDMQIKKTEKKLKKLRSDRKKAEDLQTQQLEKNKLNPPTKVPFHRGPIIPQSCDKYDIITYPATHHWVKIPRLPDHNRAAYLETINQSFRVLTQNASYSKKDTKKMIIRMAKEFTEISNRQSKARAAKGKEANESSDTKPVLDIRFTSQPQMFVHPDELSQFMPQYFKDK